DAISGPVIKVVARAVQPRLVRNVASGTPVGHPLHPLLTDLPIGAWTMATVLDLIGGKASAPAADLLVKVGIVATVPTALSGLNDWSDTYGPETRIGVAHAAMVHAALGLYVASAVSRSRGNRTKGKVVGLVGLGALMAGGYLGGHLAFVKGVNVSRVAHEEGPDEWTPVLADAELGEGEHRKVDAGGTSVLLHRSGGRILALNNICSHMGGPLDEGTFADGCVTCPWHGSMFRMTDGSIYRGPASTEQPTYDTRVTDGQIEVRAAS
ncbi:MAG: Rieske 2Fe-2S domain-containing protein, partial [Dermatophilaceae bacterium]